MTGPILNLGEQRIDNGDHGDRNRPQWIGSKSDPMLLHPNVTAVATKDHAIVTITGDVALAEAPETVIAKLTYTMDVAPDATIDVTYTVDWTSDEANAWELGVKFNLPQAYDFLSWYRDAEWTAYPPGYIGAPMGRVDSKALSFRSTKRNAVWATFTDAGGNRRGTAEKRRRLCWSAAKSWATGFSSSPVVRNMPREASVRIISTAIGSPSSLMNPSKADSACGRSREHHERK